MSLRFIGLLLFFSGMACHARSNPVPCKDSTQYIYHLIRQGEAYWEKKDLENCIISFREALQISENQQNYLTASFTYSNIAKVCFEWQQPSVAVEFAEEALQYALKTDEKGRIGMAYSVLGVYTCEAGQYAEGIEILEKKAIPILKETGDDLQLCKTYHRLIMTYKNLGKVQPVIQYMKQFEKLTHVLKTDEDWYHYYRAKSMELRSVKRHKEALYYIHKVIDIIDKGYKNPINHQAYYMAANCYMSLSDYPSGYKMLEKAYQQRDSAFSRRQSLQLAYYTVEHRLHDKQIEIAQLEQKQLEQEASMLRERSWTIIAAVALLVTILILLLKRQRQKTHLMEIARAAEEKEHQYLMLQKDTERRLTRKYIEGLENERNRLATELHDDVCNRLMGLEMKTRSLTNEMSSAAAEQIEVLADIRNRVRNVSHELMPPVFQFATLDEMLNDHIRHLELPEGMRAEYSSTEGADWNSIGEEVGFEFYRIIQEALSNCIKHSHATRIDVSLCLTGQQLSAYVQDNGKGFDMDKKKGIGLRIICQRIHSIGGECRLHSEPGTGTKVEISISIG